MEIKDFNYRETPFKKTRIYEVHTLSENGLQQYLNKNSYIHKYLKSQSPQRMYMDENSNLNNCLYSSDMSKRNSNLEYGEDKYNSYFKDHTVKNPNQKQSVITINESNFHKNIYYKPMDRSLDDKNLLKNNIKINDNQHAYIKPLENIEVNHNIDNDVSGNDNSSKNLEERNSNVSNISNSSDLRKKNTFLQTSKNLFFGNNKFSPHNKHSRFNRLKYSEDYSETINSLKEKVQGNLILHNTSKHSISPNKFNYGNFKSFEVPHLDYKRNSDNFRINLIRNKLESTLFKTNSIPFNAAKISNKNSLENSREIDGINKKIVEENIKLKNYFNNVEKFSEKTGTLYPSLSQITNSSNLRTTKLNLMNNKYMGERYDPTNFS